VSRPEGAGRTAAILDVRGGVTGIEASHEEVRALARRYDAAGDLLREWSCLGAHVLADPDLLVSAPLSPATFAAAEAAVAAATTGPDGALTASLGWEVDAALVRAALAYLETADTTAHAALEELDREVGFLLGSGLRLSAPLLPIALPLLERLPVEETAVEHPRLVEHLVNGGGGLLGGLLGLGMLTRDTESASALLGAAYGDRPTRAVPRADIRLPSGQRRPADLTELVDHLREVAALSPEPDSPDNGTIAIQTIGDEGGVRHVVYLPGTDDMRTLPWTQDQDVRDFGTNLRLVGGLDDGYRRGILDAMHAAGIGAHDPVLLVGHSQGGMEAASILGHGSDFHVTNVVTAGSPTAQVHGFPDGSHVLSLEHRGDVVPLLDGEPNPDTVEQTTVTFSDGPLGDVDHNHGYPAYLDGAAATDASDDPSVREQLQSLRDHGFLVGDGGGAPTVSTQVFQVVRAP
jgi:hypothetical protein